ncbi:MAG: photosystem II protein Psb27 [Geitlerinemataceae cyanobacterium]
MMNRFLSRILALVIVVLVGLTSCAPSGMSGNYSQDTLTLIGSLRTAIELPDNTPEKATAQAEARQKINEFYAFYRRDTSKSNLPSFTSMQTALNSLASHYQSYGNRPLSDKLKTQLEDAFGKVEASLNRES